MRNMKWSHTFSGLCGTSAAGHGRSALCAVAVLAACVHGSGCATLVHGSRQELRVVTEPPGATASACGQTITTPGSLRLPRRLVGIVVRIDKHGYEGLDVPLRREVSGAVWWNFALIPVGAEAGYNNRNRHQWFAGVEEAVLGGTLLPGAAFAIDWATGAMYGLEPGELRIVLVPVPENLGGRP